jgi:DNA-binding transcriptional LysR family regulator
VPDYEQSSIEGQADQWRKMDKLRAIKFFCRAVEAKSFTSAAHTLDVPPSVLSKTVSSLEAELRFTLFNRSTRRLSLTEAGTAYYEYCRQLILDMEEAEALARDGTVQAAGTLRIGFHPAFRTCLCRRMGEFLKANPSVNVELAITNSPATLLDEGADTSAAVDTASSDNPGSARRRYIYAMDVFKRWTA